MSHAFLVFRFQHIVITYHSSSGNVTALKGKPVSAVSFLVRLKPAYSEVPLLGLEILEENKVDIIFRQFATSIKSTDQSVFIYTIIAGFFLLRFSSSLSGLS